jgi:hypothetical protein
MFRSRSRAQPKYFSRLDGKQNPDQVRRPGALFKSLPPRGLGLAVAAGADQANARRPRACAQRCPG